MYHDKQKKKKKVTDNESVGSLHIPNTQLQNVLIRTQHHANWVLVFFFAMT